MKEKALLRLAKFCDKLLRRGEEDPAARKDISLREFPTTVVECFLETILWGPKGIGVFLSVFLSFLSLKINFFLSSPANDYIPRLLQLLELYPEVLSLFVEKAQKIPSRQFLKWVPQMVALLDKAESRGVYGILEKIANDYPEFLRYPFKISGEQFNFTDPKSGPENRKNVDKLMSKLYSKAHDEFIRGLKELTNPEHIFSDWIESTQGLLEKEQDAKTPQEKQAIRDKIKQEYKELYSLVLDTRAIKADVRARFASLKKPDISQLAKLCGNEGADISIATMKTIAAKKDEIAEWAKKQPQPPPSELLAYSGWLAHYQASDSDSVSHIPSFFFFFFPSSALMHPP